MARRKRSAGGSTVGATPDRAAADLRASAPNADPAAHSGATSAPPPALTDPAGAGGAAAILALTLFLAPALGAPREELLQDTLKSIVVSFGALAAALWLLWAQRRRAAPLHWHAVVALPLLLMAWALGSMAWSHTYLAGVEAIRWFVFALLLWVGANVLTRERVVLLAWGIHAGALVASLWAALQFWTNFGFFPQGPNPASTFVNRNFFAEFVVCALPFSAWLTLRAGGSAARFLMTLSTGFILVALMMTGTRSALASLLLLAAVLPLAAWQWRDQLCARPWPMAQRWAAAGVLLATVLGLGMIGTGNPRVADEGRGLTPIERAWTRTLSMATAEEYAVRSFSIRLQMWKDTSRMIAGEPLTGVGAGAWEVAAPLYQSPGSQLETDYYAHNEILQLLAEYGVVGWLFLLALVAYWLDAAWRTWRDRRPAARAEAPIRMVALASLMALLLVSNAGFPWRLAATGAIFAMALAVLAASDLRLGAWAGRLWGPWMVQPMPARVALVALAGCTVLASYITVQAVRSEELIVRATRMALSLTASGDPNSPRAARVRAEIVRLIDEGVRINPHYRKITPMVADEMARWGDWRNAMRVWDSVLGSRPHIVAILTNVARGHVQLGQYEQAAAYLERARRIQPDAPAVRSLDVVLLGRTGQEAKAAALARSAMDTGRFDQDLLNAAFILGQRSGDHALSVRAMTMRAQHFPDTAAVSWTYLGNFYHSVVRDDAKAVAAFRAGLLKARSPQERQMLLTQVPPVLLPGVEAATGPVASVPATTQTSASRP